MGGTKRQSSLGNETLRRRQSFHDSSTSKDEELSRSMSWALRHAAPSLGLSVRSDGYIAVNDLLNCKHQRFSSNFSLEDVQRVVELNDKKRFQLIVEETIIEGGQKNCWMIRACQGHSLKHVLSRELLTPIPQEELKLMDRIIHGTTKRAWDLIRRKGALNRMKRNHIHFATALPDDQNTGIVSGIRAKREVDIYIDGTRCAAGAVQFYRSNNDVILSAGVKNEGVLPLQFVAKVIEVQSGNILFTNEESTS